MSDIIGCNRTGCFVKRGSMQEKYNKVLAQLHTCLPSDKPALKKLLNYYYDKLN